MLFAKCQTFCLSLNVPITQTTNGPPAYRYSGSIFPTAAFHKYNREVCLDTEYGHHNTGVKKDYFELDAKDWDLEATGINK